jgi:hypothetical protein
MGRTPLSLRTKIAIKFWGGMPLQDIALKVGKSNTWVSYQTDIIFETRPRYSKLVTVN